MSEERLEEIKDSVNFQREILTAHNMETICVDEEQELIEEIERLNNIINELEKWLEKQHQFIIEIPAFTKEISIEHKTMEICYENILDKIQELKGSDKE